MSSLRVGYVEATAGPQDIFAAPGDLAGWNTTTGPWTVVTLLARYFPAPHQILPPRAPNNAGASCAFPEPEADALVAAGFATATGTASPQEGVWTP